MIKITNKNEKTHYAALVFLFAPICVIFYFFALWTDSSLEYALSSWQGRQVEVPLWISFMANLIANVFMILFNLTCLLMQL